jgi:hypothetical protein
MQRKSFWKDNNNSNLLDPFLFLKHQVNGRLALVGKDHLKISAGLVVSQEEPLGSFKFSSRGGL